MLEQLCPFQAGRGGGRNTWLDKRMDDDQKRYRSGGRDLGEDDTPIAQSDNTIIVRLIKVEDDFKWCKKPILTSGLINVNNEIMIIMLVIVSV